MAAPSAPRRPARPPRRRPLRTAPALLPVPALLVLTGCAAASTPVTIGPAPTGAGPACVVESGREVCVTGAPSASPDDGTAGGTATSRTTPARTATPEGTKRRSPGTEDAWGGGTRVGTFATRGTVRGRQEGEGDEVRTTGTCDVARDVRTVSAPLEENAVLVVEVTGRRVASVTLTVRGGTRWRAEYVGASAADVVTLTPTRTVVRDARLVRVSGPDAPAVTVDADFDC